MMQQSPEPARAVLPTAQNYPSPVIVHTPAPLPAAAPASAASAASAAFDPVKPAARPAATRLRRSGGPAPAAATPVAPRPVPRMICEDKTGKEIPCPR
jgi:hypothetical protein